MRAPLGIKTKRESGFTIIEVMIVLAVASLIMLIVLLAVPALQRSTRNTNRTADATKIASAASECLSNRNNVVASCNTTTGSPVSNMLTGTAQTLDASSLKQLTAVAISTTGAIPAGTAAANVSFGYKCADDGASASAGQATQIAVTFNVEGGNGSVPRCIGT